MIFDGNSWVFIEKLQLFNETLCFFSEHVDVPGFSEIIVCSKQKKSDLFIESIEFSMKQIS